MNILVEKLYKYNMYMYKVIQLIVLYKVKESDIVEIYRAGLFL